MNDDHARLTQRIKVILGILINLVGPHLSQMKLNFSAQLNDNSCNKWTDAQQGEEGGISSSKWLRFFAGKEQQEKIYHEL